MSWYEELDVWTADYLPDMAYEKDVPLRRYTSFRIGGAARRMAFPRSGEELVLLVSRALELGARPFVLGNGTNVLFPDEGVERLVVNTREMNRVCRGENENEIIAECGASMANMAVFAQKEGLSGLEFAHGIPGSVGGGVTMNAGAYGAGDRERDGAVSRRGRPDAQCRGDGVFLSAQPADGAAGGRYAAGGVPFAAGKAGGNTEKNG